MQVKMSVKLLLWSAFSLFYYLGFTNVFKMIDDAAAQNSGAQFYSLIYIALIAHLINKYEKEFPRACSWFVSICGLAVITAIVLTKQAMPLDLLYSPFYLCLYLALPICYELFRFVILKNTSNSGQD
ncbi:hypothetical protein [Pseudoalteromonas denitrificans]|uniref:Uncharacterized protein n=1 Tax=Pseudoalteromonas denitrificans DSM 6059 TaxID=1123010 RepID=A0A1I1NY98_9GAMM|nr:hypothetical protein [Pseudoalteromonas denitrificans]SFD00468.1 hypothetical protein SAMN02745724_03164 [Pseudoalteromonas denitrificans DSM 6059]